MKLKGINVLEQHCEKIVVGVIGVGLVGVLGWQLLDQTKIKVGKGDPVPIQNAFQPVESAATKLISEMEQQNPTFPTSPDVTPLSGFSQSLASGVSPAGTLPAMGHAFALGGGSVAPTGDALYTTAVVPAPTKIFAASFRGTIDPMETVSTKELGAFLPKEQPFDKAAATIEAVFDGKALRASLEADPDGTGPISALPIDWWLDKVEIINVVVEREERSSSGDWGNKTTLAALPGRLDFMKTWDEKVKVGGDAINAVETAKAKADEIQRPEFYHMIVGEWASASILTQREGSNANPAEMGMLRDKINELDKKLKDKEQELSQLPAAGGRPANPPPAPPRPPGGGGGGGGGGGRPGAGGGRPPVAPPDVKPEQTPEVKRRNLQREIDGIKAELDRAKKRLSEMGGDVPAPVAPDGAAVQPTPATALRLLDNGDLHIHAHDITVVPGTTYRYHVRVVLNNPVFGKDIMLKQGDAGQAELAKPSTIAGEWSEWSRDVEVDRDAYWFVTSTQSDTLRQNPSTARAMLYKFYYGYYRRAEVSLEPGDALVGETKLPKLWIYELDKLAAGPDGANPPAVPQPPQRDRGAPAPGAAVPPAGPPQPPNTKPAQDKLVFTDTATVLLMDVKPGSGPDDKSLAVLKTTEGELIMRSPEAEKESPVYKRVNSSAEAGLLEARPKEIAKPKTPKPAPDEPKGPPGKGGGGGGGGKGGG